MAEGGGGIVGCLLPRFEFQKHGKGPCLFVKKPALQEWAKQCEKARKKGGRGLNQALRTVGEGSFLVGNNHG